MFSQVVTRSGRAQSIYRRHLALSPKTELYLLPPRFQRPTSESREYLMYFSTDQVGGIRQPLLDNAIIRQATLEFLDTILPRTSRLLILTKASRLRISHTIKHPIKGTKHEHLLL